MSIIQKKLNVSVVTVCLALRGAYSKIAHLTFSLCSPLISSDRLNDGTEAEFIDGLYCPACDKMLKTEKA